MFRLIAYLCGFMNCLWYLIWIQEKSPHLKSPQEAAKLRYRGFLHRRNLRAFSWGLFKWGLFSISHQNMSLISLFVPLLQSVVVLPLFLVRWQSVKSHYCGWRLEIYNVYNLGCGVWPQHGSFWSFIPSHKVN